jgi:cell division protein FtsB
MRLLLIVMVALVGLIQYPLWMGRGGWFSVWDMQAQVADQRMINDGLTARNVALAAEVEDLRSGTDASEERARGELGMMRQGEVFVQILPPGAKPPELKSTLKPTLKPVTGTKPATR